VQAYHSVVVIGMGSQMYVFGPRITKTLEGVTIPLRSRGVIFCAVIVDALLMCHVNTNILRMFVATNDDEVYITVPVQREWVAEPIEGIDNKVYPHGGIVEQSTKEHITPEVTLVSGMDLSYVVDDSLKWIPDMMWKGHNVIMTPFFQQQDNLPYVHVMDEEFESRSRYDTFMGCRDLSKWSSYDITNTVLEYMIDAKGKQCRTSEVEYFPPEYVSMNHAARIGIDSVVRVTDEPRYRGQRRFHRHICPNYMCRRIFTHTHTIRSSKEQLLYMKEHPQSIMCEECREYMVEDPSRSYTVSTTYHRSMWLVGAAILGMGLGYRPVDSVAFLMRWQGGGGVIVRMRVPKFVEFGCATHWSHDQEVRFQPILEKGIAVELLTYHA